MQAINYGQKIFGENYLQEALKKQEVLKAHDLEWHFIGPIQSNKCKLIAENFSWVHTIDRLNIAKRINDARRGMPPINICIQINIDSEESKSGIMINEIDGFLDRISQYKYLSLRGIMAIPSKLNALKENVNSYNILKLKYDKLSNKYENIDTLSLGMSNDYKLALSKGSNMIRIGSLIFGERK